MDRLSINLSDYTTTGNGFGSVSRESVDQLNKALSAGDITGRETTNMYDASGSPLKVESLEKLLSTSLSVRATSSFGKTFQRNLLTIPLRNITNRLVTVKTVVALMLKVNYLKRKTAYM